MKVLIVGSGGREHALAWKLGMSAEVHVAPGNAGVADAFPVHAVPASDRPGLVGLARKIAADLVVVGPEDPLIAGLADDLRAAGVTTFGPGATGARLEASKAHSKALMRQAGIPTADGGVFTGAEAAREFVRQRCAAGRQVVVKASGAALGKGVVVAATEREALEAVEAMLARGDLGEAGRTVVVEDRLAGREFSLLTLVNERGIQSLPVAQDHKRVGDGDTGPNTGGMGAFSPVGWVSDALVEETEALVVRPILELVPDYRGVLFSGLMVVEGRPYCLEYNVRFGDPETQTVVRRLGEGFAEALRATAEGAPIPAVAVRPEAAVTVVMASDGYPGPYAKGAPVSIGPLPEGVVLFHAGTARDPDGSLVTSGGRVIGVSGVGPTLAEARAAAYAGVEAVRFTGARFRRDIGAE